MADIVFLALHGTCGEDGRVQAAFDLMGIPYTGAGYLGSGLAMDKDLTKRLIAHLGVHTPQWQRVSYTEQEVEDLAAATQVPCVVKRWPAVLPSACPSPTPGRSSTGP